MWKRVLGETSWEPLIYKINMTESRRQHKTMGHKIIKKCYHDCMSDKSVSVLLPSCEEGVSTVHALHSTGRNPEELGGWIQSHTQSPRLTERPYAYCFGQSYLQQTAKNQRKHSWQLQQNKFLSSIALLNNAIFYVILVTPECQMYLAKQFICPVMTIHPVKSWSTATASLKEHLLHKQVLLNNGCLN